MRPRINTCTLNIYSPGHKKTSLAFVFTMERATIIRRDANQMESAASLYLSLSFFVCPSQTPFSQDFQRGERDEDRMALADFFGSKRLALQTVLLPQPWLCLENGHSYWLHGEAWACIGGRIKTRIRKEKTMKERNDSILRYTNEQITRSTFHSFSNFASFFFPVRPSSNQRRARIYQAMLCPFSFILLRTCKAGHTQK